jgi:putative ABC transport system permease protein
VDIETISVPRLALSFIPVAIVVALMWRWSHRYGRALQAIARMLIQLTLIGYVLVYIFQTESGLVISGVLTIMLVAASWIALNTVDLEKGSLFPASLYSVAATRTLVSAQFHDSARRHDFLRQHDQHQPGAGALTRGA